MAAKDIYYEYMRKKTIKDIGIKGKNVLVRVDYNLSFVKKNGKRVIADDTRVKQSLETLKYLINAGVNKIVLVSHLGKPKNGFEDRYSLGLVAERLEALLKKKVVFVASLNLGEAYKMVSENKNDKIFLLENMRFWPGEKKNSLEFSRELARFGDVFVNDAFGSSHRAHASVVGVADCLPAVAGLLLEKEVGIIGEMLEKPKPPFVVVLGGAKATTKIPMIYRLMEKADYMLLGGGVANTFLKAFGYNVGRSIYSRESVRIAQALIWRATRVNTRLFLPSDVVVGSFFSGEKVATVLSNEIPSQFMALDIGKKTISDYCEVVSRAKTIIWNGPMGANEIAGFRRGTNAIYDAITANKSAISVVGGGDTLASIKGRENMDAIYHISTGGGAMLEFIERGELPGIEVLLNK